MKQRKGEADSMTAATLLSCSSSSRDFWHLLFIFSGEYDGYGRVDVAVETNAAKFTQFREHCAAEGVAPLKAYNDLMWQKRREWASDREWSIDYPAFDPPTDVTGFVVIQVMLEQYREFFSSWSYGNHGSHFGVVNGCLLASDIICACADDSKVHSKQLVDECNLFRADVMEDRYCVPVAVKDQVKDYLTLSEHYSLPKVELSDNDIICTNDHKTEEVNSAKISDKWKQQQEVYSRFGLIVKIW